MSFGEDEENGMDFSTIALQPDHSVTLLLLYIGGVSMLPTP